MKHGLVLICVLFAGCAALRREAPRETAGAPVEGAPAGEAERRASQYERILGSFTTRSELAVYVTPALISRLSNKEAKTVEALAAIADAFEKRGAARGEAAARLNHGAFLWSIGQTEEAYREMTKARARFEATGDLDGTARAHEWLGWFFKESGEEDAAHEHLAIAYQLFAKLENEAAKKRIIAYAD